jgi:hypothetical protein
MENPECEKGLKSDLSKEFHQDFSHSAIGAKVEQHFHSTKLGPSRIQFCVERLYMQGNYSDCLALILHWMISNYNPNRRTTSSKRNNFKRLSSMDMIEMGARTCLKLNKPQWAVSHFFELLRSSNSAKDPNFIFLQASCYGAIAFYDCNLMEHCSSPLCRAHFAKKRVSLLKSKQLYIESLFKTLLHLAEMESEFTNSIDKPIESPSCCCGLALGEYLHYLKLRKNDYVALKRIGYTLLAHLFHCTNNQQQSLFLRRLSEKCLMSSLTLLKRSLCQGPVSSTKTSKCHGLIEVRDVWSAGAACFSWMELGFDFERNEWNWDDVWNRLAKIPPINYTKENERYVVESAGLEVNLVVELIEILKRIDENE